MKIKEICEFLNQKAPESLALDFDNVGLLVGKDDREVTKILFCLDCDEFVVKEANEKGAELIVTHHPIIFNPLKSVTDKTPVERAVLFAIEEKIAIYSMHTNLDAVKGGLNDYFFKMLGITSQKPLCDDFTGRIVTLKKTITVNDLVNKIKDAFNLKFVRTTAKKDREIQTIALCTGAGGFVYKDALNKGADVFITGDTKHSDTRDAHFSGMDIIEISHYDSEKISAYLVKKWVDEKFTDKIETFISSSNCDVFNIL